MVCRQCGVDATVSTVAYLVGKDPQVTAIYFFTGDQDFAHTVQSIREQYNKPVYILTFASTASKDLCRAASGTIDLSGVYREIGFERILRQRRREGGSDGGDILGEVLAWRDKDVMDPRLLVADARVRPCVPDTFADLHEFVTSFTGLVLEEIRESIAQALTCPDPNATIKVTVLDAKRGGQLVLAVTRGAATRWKGREVFFKAVAHKKHQKVLRDMLAVPCYVTVLTTVLNHERALSAHSRLLRMGLPHALHMAILDPLANEALPPVIQAPPGVDTYGLDLSQYQAYNSIMNSTLPIEVLWGPPGTGKTKTIVTALLHLLQQRRLRILVCAPTNVAVLNVANRLVTLAPHLTPLMLLVGDESRMLNLTAQTSAILLESKLASEECRHLTADDLIRQARLLLCTVASAGRRDLVDNRVSSPFDLLILDEASQIMEAHMPIVLQLGVKRVVLAGDPRQLPAVVRSSLAQEGKLGRSLMERLMNLGRPPVKKLLAQYRMHPEISLFPHQAYYKDDQGELMDAPLVLSRSVPWQHDHAFPPYAFFAFDGQEGLGPNSSSIENESEASVAAALLRAFLRKYGNDAVKPSVGIITPYRAQVAVIEKRIQALLGGIGSNVEVSTVDGFQGREVDVVIVSTTRSNPRREIGFLQDQRRLTVTLTRARYSLWLIGDEHTLGRHPGWSQLLTDCKKRGAFHSLDNVLGPDAPEWLGREGLRVQFRLALSRQFSVAHLHDIFNGSPWKMELSAKVIKVIGRLRSANEERVLRGKLPVVDGGHGLNGLVDLLGDLAKGKAFSLRRKFPDLVLNIPNTDLRLLASVEIDETRLTQIVCVWDVAPKGMLQAARQAAHRRLASRPPWYRPACEIVISSEGKRVPMVWSSREDLEATGGYATEPEPPGLRGGPKTQMEGEEEDVDRLEMNCFFEITPLRLSHVLGEGKKYVDIPLRLTAQQEALVTTGQSSIIVGRSGTGKTTVAIRRALYEHIMWQKTNMIVGQEEKKGEEGATRSAMPVLRQAFLTVSPQLTLFMKRFFRRQQRADDPFYEEGDGATDGDANIDTWGVAELNAIDETRGTRAMADGMPASFLEIRDEHFPLFLTFSTLLELLDASLHKPFWISAFTPQEQMRHHVTFRRFQQEYWQHLDQGLTRELNAGKVWSETVTIIKGSLQSARTGEGLSEENYVALATRDINLQRRDMTSTSMGEDEARRIYRAFQAYEERKIKEKDWDTADRVLHVHRELSFSLSRPLPHVHRLYIDEVQDLTEAQVSMLRFVCPDARTGYVFGGDRAQTITEGVNFRFESVKDYLFELDKEGKVGKDKGTGEWVVPEIAALTENKRTHQQILDVASQVLGALRWLFPGDLDRLEGEMSPCRGPRPIFLKEASQDILLSLFKNATEHLFGAKQALLVRDEGAKGRLRETWGFKGVVLTICESKGLEFDDVLLYDFFADSPMTISEWRVLGPYLRSQGVWLDESFPKDAERNPPRQLAEELKMLYVAITRCKNRLIVFDRDRERRRPLFDLMTTKHLVSCEWDGSQTFFKESTPQEWKELGCDLFAKKLFEDALQCFLSSGDQAMAEKTRATIFCRDAQEAERGGRLRDASELYEKASEIYERLQEDEQVKDNLEKSARCLEEDGRDLDRAANLYMKLEMFSDAGRVLMLLSRWKQAAEAFIRVGDEENALKSCYKGMDPTLAEELVLGREAGNPTIRDKWLDSFCHRLKDEQGQEATIARLLGLMSGPEPKRRFFKRKRMHRELCQMEEDLGNFLEAARLAEGMREFEWSVRLFTQLGLANEVVRIRTKLVRERLWDICQCASQSPTDAAKRHELLKSLGGNLEEVQNMPQYKDVPAQLRAELDYYNYINETPLEGLNLQPESSLVEAGAKFGALPDCVEVTGRMLVLLRILGSGEDPDPVRRLDMITGSAMTLMDIVREALTSLRTGKKGRGFRVCTSFSSTTAAQAPGAWDMEGVLSQVLSLLVYTIHLLATSGAANEVKAARVTSEKALLSDPLGRPMKRQERKQHTGDLCMALAREWRLRCLFLEAFDCHAKLAAELQRSRSRLPQNTASSLVMDGLLISGEKETAELTWVYRKAEELVIPVLPDRYCDMAVAEALKPEHPFHGLVAGANRLSISSLLVLPQPPNFDYLLSRTVLLNNSLGFPLGILKRRGEPPKLWYAFHWQQFLSHPSLSCREQSRRYLAYMIYYPLTAKILSSRRDGILDRLMAYPPHTFLALLERLVAISLVAYSDRFWPALPMSYVKRYLQGNEVVLSGLLNFNQRAPYGTLFRGLVNALIVLLSTPSLIETWASRSYGNDYSRDRQPELHATTRLRCWILIATILANCNFEEALADLASGRGPQLDMNRKWAEHNPKWSKLQTWVTKLARMVRPSEFDVRRLYVPRKMFVASVCELMDHLDDSFRLLEMPWGDRFDVMRSMPAVLVYEQNQDTGLYIFTLNGKRQVLTARATVPHPPPATTSARGGTDEHEQKPEDEVKDEMELPPVEEGQGEEAVGEEEVEEQEGGSELLGFSENFAREAEAVWTAEDMPWTEEDERRSDEYKGMFLRMAVDLVRLLEKTKKNLEEVLATEDAGLKKALVDDKWPDAAVLKKDASDALDDVMDDMGRMNVQCCVEAYSTINVLESFLDEMMGRVRRVEETMLPAFRVVQKLAKKGKKASSSSGSAGGKRGP